MSISEVHRSLDHDHLKSVINLSIIQILAHRAFVVGACIFGSLGTKRNVSFRRWSLLNSPGLRSTQTLGQVQCCNVTFQVLPTCVYNSSLSRQLLVSCRCPAFHGKVCVSVETIFLDVPNVSGQKQKSIKIRNWRFLKRGENQIVWHCKSAPLCIRKRHMSPCM